MNGNGIFYRTAEKLLRIFKAMPIAFLFVITPVNPGVSGEDPDAWPDSSDPYSWQFQQTRITTYTFFVDDAGFKYESALARARETRLPPPEFRKLQKERTLQATFAFRGHTIGEGTGIVLSRRIATFGTDIFMVQSVPRKALSMHVPQIAVGDSITIDIGEENDSGVTVFWSYWSVIGGGCFAYATGGSIRLKRLPLPPDGMGAIIAKRETVQLGPTRRYETIIADLDLQFGRIVVDEYTKKACPPFNLQETVRFYRRDLNSVPWE